MTLVVEKVYRVREGISVIMVKTPDNVGERDALLRARRDDENRKFLLLAGRLEVLHYAVDKGRRYHQLIPV